jgi:hypothetical protein
VIRSTGLTWMASERIDRIINGLVRWAGTAREHVRLTNAAERRYSGGWPRALHPRLRTWQKEWDAFKHVYWHSMIR